MFWIYRLIFLPALIVVAPRYLLRMSRRGGYRHSFGQRFGAGHDLPPRRRGVQRIWLQAVSVGEVLAVAPLIDSLLRDGGVEIYLTTTTSTGYRLAEDKYPGRVLGVGYFPIDWWLFSARAWRSIDPDLVILTEGERWPEHIHQANRRGVPVLSVNARLSDRSYRRMQRFRSAARSVLRGIDRVLPCSAHDEARFRELGVPSEKLFTTGNLKLDLRIPELSAEEREKLAKELGLGGGLVLLGASTWPGEEVALLDAALALRGTGLPCSLVLVPRHAERRGEIETVLRETRVRIHFRSRGPAPRETDVIVADTTGELRKLMQLADLVFIGKSLPPNEGGQTPVEAAALAKPMIFGPAMSNFRLIADELVHRGAAVRVSSASELRVEIGQLARDPVRRDALARAAAAWRRENAGAVDRTVVVIREELAKVAARRKG